MKPIILYVDDDARNLTVFEHSLPDDWEVVTFSNPVSALSELEKIQPWVIVSDQRMPGTSGVEFLKVAKKICPSAIRIIVTAFSDEGTVIKTVREAKIFDYIKKPWDVDDLEASIEKAVQYYCEKKEKERLLEELQKREHELTERNRKLTELTEKLEHSQKSEKTIRSELECWVPPFVLWALTKKDVKFPIKKDLVCITFDVIQSSAIHGVEVGGKSLRARIIQTFSESVIRHGGWRESHSGDSAYAHFGLMEGVVNPYEAALGVAREFRVSLRSISEVHGVQVECGIAIHVAKDAVVDVHEVQLNTPQGVVTQKSFDTTSAEIDLVHRMEKLVHALSGTNIIMSQEFVDKLESCPKVMKKIGSHLFSGQAQATELYMISSDLVNEDELEKFKQDLRQSEEPETENQEKKKAA